MVTISVSRFRQFGLTVQTARACLNGKLRPQRIRPRTAPASRQPAPRAACRTRPPAAPRPGPASSTARCQAPVRGRCAQAGHPHAQARGRRCGRAHASSGEAEERGTVGNGALRKKSLAYGKERARERGSEGGRE